MNSTEENTMLNLGLKLGENLKKFRLQRELTQEQLADVLGVSAQAVSRWENGTTYPDITLLPTIVSYFEITLDELMGMENWRSEEQLKELLGQLEENGSALPQSVHDLRAYGDFRRPYRLQQRCFQGFRQNNTKSLSFLKNSAKRTIIQVVTFLLLSIIPFGTTSSQAGNYIFALRTIPIQNELCAYTNQL